jgi:hypothetical protein
LKKPKKLNHLYIILFEHGQGTIQVDQGQYNVTGNLAIVGFPGQVLKWNFPQALSAIQLLVTKDVYESIACVSQIRVGALEPISALELDADTFTMLQREFFRDQKTAEQSRAGFRTNSGKVQVELSHPEILLYGTTGVSYKRD